MQDGERRRAELVSSLGALRTRITDACTAAGRDPRSVTLVAVTKTYPAGDVRALDQLGVRDIGESRDQEARAKLAELGDLAVRWHFVGRLQSRKCRSVASYAHAVHSVDRIELVGKLADGVDRAERDPIGLFVQVSLDDDPERGGVPASELDRLADAVAERDELQLLGVMAIPPMDADADASFATLRELAERVRANHPGADAISAGMSADLEAAVAHGSTHVRVGTALLGRREASFS